MYLEKLSSKEDILNINELQLILDDFTKKASGLPSDNSFKEIGTSLEIFQENLFKEIIKLLDFDFNADNLKEPYKSNSALIKKLIEQMKNDLPKVFNTREDFTPIFSNLDTLPVGTKSFREHKPIKDLNIMNLPSDKVVLSIESIFNKENPTSKWRDNSNDTIEDKIAIAYTLMNWAGYYPDDFDKIKKNKDRYNASKNDMQHAVMASKSNYLISNDNAFLMKCIASYEYSGSNTMVCSSKNFIEEYFSYIG